VYYLAAGATALDAATRAAPHGAAVLASIDPLAAQLTIRAGSVTRQA
jgi:hypothetical protein